MAQADQTSPAPQPPRSFLANANLLSRLTMASRVFGLIRDKVCSYFLGVGTVWSAFWMGFQIPNLFRRIFGEGALTAIFVPAYTQVQLSHGKAQADQLARSVLVLLFAVLLGITAMGECVLLPLALNTHLLPENRLAAGMIAVMLPYTLAICVVAILAAFANVHERFASAALAPITTSLLMAAAAAAPILIFGGSLPLSQRIWWVAVAVLASGVVQLLMLGWTAHRCGLGWGSCDFRAPALRGIIRRMGPMIVGFSAVQINTFFDSQIAWWFSPDAHNGLQTVHWFGRSIHLPMLAGALGKLSVAQRIYMLPVGVFGVAIATAIFPRLSALAAESKMDDLKKVLQSGLRRGLFLSIPATVGMIIIAHQLITTIYLGGRVSPADVWRATNAARWFCAGIWAFELQMILIRVFYARQNTRTPMLVAIIAVAINLGMNLLLIWPLGVGGIAASTTISAIGQCAILFWLLRRDIGPLGIRAMRRVIGQILLATGVMAAVALGVAQLFHRYLAPHPIHPVIAEGVCLLLVVAAAALAYGLMARLLKIPELAHAPLIGRLAPRAAQYPDAP